METPEERKKREQLESMLTKRTAVKVTKVKERILPSITQVVF